MVDFRAHRVWMVETESDGLLLGLRSRITTGLEDLTAQYFLLAEGCEAVDVSAVAVYYCR